MKERTDSVFVLLSGEGSTRYLMSFILRSKVDCSTMPMGVDPAILLPSTVWRETLREGVRERSEGEEGKYG